MTCEQYDLDRVKLAINKIASLWDTVTPEQAQQLAARLRDAADVLDAHALNVDMSNGGSN
jgi:hypothetical protein